MESTLFTYRRTAHGNKETIELQRSWTKIRSSLRESEECWNAQPTRNRPCLIRRLLRRRPHFLRWPSQGQLIHRMRTQRWGWRLWNKQKKITKVTCSYPQLKTSSCPKDWQSRRVAWKFFTAILLAVTTPLKLTSALTCARSKLDRTWSESCITRDRTNRKLSWKKTIECYNGFYLRHPCAAIRRS